MFQVTRGEMVMIVMVKKTHFDLIEWKVVNDYMAYMVIWFVSKGNSAIFWHILEP